MVLQKCRLHFFWLCSGKDYTFEILLDWKGINCESKTKFQLYWVIMFFWNYSRSFALIPSGIRNRPSHTFSTTGIQHTRYKVSNMKASDHISNIIHCLVFHRIRWENCDMGSQHLKWCLISPSSVSLLEWW